MKPFHLIIYTPDGIAISHHYEDEVVIKMADAISQVTDVAAKQGFISSDEIAEAAEKFVEQLKQRGRVK